MLCTLCMGPALHSPVAPIATRIPSNAGERGPRMNAKWWNYHHLCQVFIKLELFNQGASILSNTTFPWLQNRGKYEFCLMNEAPWIPMVQ